MTAPKLKPERPNWLYALTFVLFPGILGGAGFVFGPLFTPGHSSYGQFEYLLDSQRWAGGGALMGLVLWVVFHSVISRTTRPESGLVGLPLEPNPNDYVTNEQYPDVMIGQ